jgi:hypothetical protein
MTYRFSRKFTSSSFFVDGQLCKIFLEPMHEYRPGYWLWNVGFAIGKSRRQLNDWYWKRKNKRARTINNHINGRSGMKAIRRGFEEVLRLRWNIAPGDVLVLDCTSGDPDRQFHAWSRWHRYHPEWTINYDKQEFFWHRPPYPDDELRKYFYITPVTPLDPLANTLHERYFDCFRAYPKPHNMVPSISQTADQSIQAPTSQPSL